MEEYTTWPFDKHISHLGMREWYRAGDPNGKCAASFAGIERTGLEISTAAGDGKNFASNFGARFLTRFS